MGNLRKLKRSLEKLEKKANDSENNIEFYEEKKEKKFYNLKKILNYKNKEKKTNYLGKNYSRNIRDKRKSLG